MKRTIHRENVDVLKSNEGQELKSFSGDICDVNPNKKGDPELHMCQEYVFTNKQDTFTCHYCGYMCKRKYDMSRHVTRVHLNATQRIITKRHNLSCAHCSKTFSNKIDMKKHIFKIHLDRETKPTFRRGYCCDVCGEGFPDQKTMLAHRHVVHKNAAQLKWSTFRLSLGRLRFCAVCEKNYRSGRHYEEHTCTKEEPQEILDEMHNLLQAKPCYKCDVCYQCFQWIWIYRQHRESAHPLANSENWEALLPVEIPYHCLTCCKSFENGDAVEGHECFTVTAAMIKSFICNICGNSYCRKSDYWRHLRSKHKDVHPEASERESITVKKKSTIKCPYCELTKWTKSEILSHIKVAHQIETDTPFICIPCNKVFKRKATMDTHNQIYHPKGEKPEETIKMLKDAEILLNGETAYHCTICNRNMFNSTRFLAHYRLHNVERKYTCDLCGKQTRTQHQLNSHIKFIHLNIRNYECDICGKSFHAKQSCEEHRRIHTGERPFSCEICGKTFIAMNALFTHKKFHNDFYAHPCSMCDKKFKVRRSLINHIRTHTGERPFKCELCPKTFNNSSRFLYHKKVTHSDARPFSCSLCGSCFKANKFLMRHMKLHNVRTHIQLRRRNNPAYFEAQSSKNAGKNTELVKSSNELESDKTQAAFIEEPFYNMQRVYEDGVTCDLGSRNTVFPSTAVDCPENDTKTHFLSGVSANVSQINFVPPATTGTNVEQHLNSGNHITCL